MILILSCKQILNFNSVWLTIVIFNFWRTLPAKACPSFSTLLWIEVAVTRYYRLLCEGSYAQFLLYFALNGDIYIVYIHTCHVLPSTDAEQIWMFKKRTSKFSLPHSSLHWSADCLLAFILTFSRKNETILLFVYSENFVTYLLLFIVFDKVHIWAGFRANVWFVWFLFNPAFNHWNYRY